LNYQQIQIQSLLGDSLHAAGRPAAASRDRRIGDKAGNKAGGKPAANPPTARTSARRFS